MYIAFLNLKIENTIVGYECKRCAKELSKKHYNENKSKIRIKAKQTYDSNKAKIKEYLLNHSCVDCGEKDIRVLEFDHIRGKKMYTIARMKLLKWDTILVEISKCEIRCANCHKKRHYKE